MPWDLTGVLVVIASPGDATEERAVVRDGLSDWTLRHFRHREVAVLPWLWERHAVAQMGDRGQALINRQAVDQADVVVAFFDSRLGRATEVDVSGTAEEINRGIELGKPVHVYFSNEPIARESFDQEQFAALQEFRTSLESRGLLGTYSSPQDLLGQIERAIEQDLDAGLSPVTPRRRGADGAELNWEHVRQREQTGIDNKGRPKFHTRVNDLIVRNAGTVAAEDLAFQVEPIDGTVFHFEHPADPVTLHPSSTLSWTLIPSLGSFGGGTGNSVKISATWREGDKEMNQVWTITLS